MGRRLSVIVIPGQALRPPSNSQARAIRKQLGVDKVYVGRRVFRSRLATRSKRHLYAGDHFVELIVAKLRVRFAEIRPGVDVIEHQLDGITMNVVI
jgi:hypothetical protein